MHVNLELSCPHCGHHGTPTGAAADLLARVRRGDMRLAMVECPACRRSVGVRAPDTSPEPPPTWRCPSQACAGWVCDIADVVDQGDDPLGCGECGETWADEATLLAAVRAISARFAHRQAVYRVSTTRVQPVPAEQQPGDYAAQVASEWDAPNPRRRP